MSSAANKKNEDSDAVLFDPNECADSADTAGGGMPRKPPQIAGTSWSAMTTGTPELNSLGHGRNEAILSEVPRIIWSSSDSSGESDLEDGEITSDVGSLDSAPVLGLALGLGRHRLALKHHPM